MMQAEMVGRVRSLEARAKWLLSNQSSPFFHIRLKQAVKYLVDLSDDVLSAQMAGERPLTVAQFLQVNAAMAKLNYLAAKHNREPNLN